MFQILVLVPVPLLLLCKISNKYKQKQVLMFYHLKTRRCVNSVHM